MPEIKFYDSVEESQLRFAVIISRMNGKWVICKHRDRTTFEFPGGHREVGESILETAKRELQEETGADCFEIKRLCTYSVQGKTRNGEVLENEVFGALFTAEIKSLKNALHSEIQNVYLTDELPQNWTYPEITERLIRKARSEGYIT